MDLDIVALTNNPTFRAVWDVARATDGDLPELDTVVALATTKEKPPTMPQTDAGIVRDVVITLPGLAQGVTKLTPRQIDRMMTNDHVRFANEIKDAPLKARFRDRKTWNPRSSDKKLAAKARYALKRFIFYSINELLSARLYGACYSEVVWTAHTAGDLGIPAEDGVPAGELVWCPEPITAIHPDSIVEILYTKATKEKPKEFNGFKCMRSDGRIITVERDRAFILTHNKRFHNLEGESALLPIYVAWYFLEQVSRASVRYMERIGQPLVIVHYPSADKVTYQGKLMTAAEYAMILASGSSNKTALAMPSDVVMNGITPTSNAKWRIEFMSESLSSSAGPLFTQAMDDLRAQIARGLVLGDLVASTDGKYGSYAQSQTHLAATDEHSEGVLLEMIMQIERYLFPRFVRYNGDNPSAQLELETEGLNLSERSMMLNFFSQLAQTHPDAARIDLLGIAATLGFPVKTDEQMRADNNLMVEQQQAMLEMQSKVQEKSAVAAEKRMDKRIEKAAAMAPAEDPTQASETAPKPAAAKKPAAKTAAKKGSGRTSTKLSTWLVDSAPGRAVYDIPFEELELFAMEVLRGQPIPT